MTGGVPLLDLAADLGAMHRRSSIGSLTVIPVLVDDLQSAMPVLRALCEVTDGVFLDADSELLQHPVVGTDDSVRVAAVNASLRSAPPGHRRVVIATAEDGLLDAQFVDPPGGPSPSPGERAVLGVARATVHHDLDTHELAVIAYRDTSVDYQFKRAVWNLAVQQLAGTPSATLRTLVFVAQASIDVEMHCQRRLGFRLAIDAGRLLYRHGDDDLTSWASSIASHEQPIVLFLGAGFSASSRLPMGNQLRNGAIRRLLGIAAEEPVTEQQLCSRFHSWMVDKRWLTGSEQALTQQQYVDQLTLEQVVRAEQMIYPSLPTLTAFREIHDSIVGAPGPAVLDLARILSKARGRIIVVEVNFDRLVESQDATLFRVFASETEFEDAADYIGRYLNGTEQEIPLLKLHGSIEHFETCVVSAEETEAGVPDGKLKAIRKLILEESPRLWIYVGASMRDRDLLRVFNDSDFGRGTEEVWVCPYMVSTVESYIESRTAFWSKRRLRTANERFISETADSFMSALNAAWADGR